LSSVIPILTAAILVGWSLLSFTLGTWSSLGYMEGTIGGKILFHFDNVCHLTKLTSIWFVRFGIRVDRFASCAQSPSVMTSDIPSLVFCPPVFSLLSYYHCKMNPYCTSTPIITWSQLDLCGRIILHWNKCPWLASERLRVSSIGCQSGCPAMKLEG